MLREVKGKGKDVPVHAIVAVGEGDSWVYRCSHFKLWHWIEVGTE
jgi:hypothetical protein